MARVFLDAELDSDNSSEGFRKPKPVFGQPSSLVFVIFPIILVLAAIIAIVLVFVSSGTAPENRNVSSTMSPTRMTTESTQDAWTAFFGLNHEPRMFSDVNTSIFEGNSRALVIDESSIYLEIQEERCIIVFARDPGSFNQLLYEGTTELRLDSLAQYEQLGQPLRINASIPEDLEIDLSVVKKSCENKPVIGIRKKV